MTALQTELLSNISAAAASLCFIALGIGRMTSFKFRVIDRDPAKTLYREKISVQYKM